MSYLSIFKSKWDYTFDKETGSLNHLKISRTIYGEYYTGNNFKYIQNLR